MCEHDPQRKTRRMRHAQPVGRYNQLAAVGQSNGGGKSPTVHNERNKKDRTRADQIRLRGEKPRTISFGASASASSPFDVGRCLRFDAPFAYRLANWRRCKPSKQCEDASHSESTSCKTEEKIIRVRGSSGAASLGDPSSDTTHNRCGFPDKCQMRGLENVESSH